MNTNEQKIISAIEAPSNQRALASAIVALVRAYEAVDAADESEAVDAAQLYAGSVRTLTDMALDIASNGLSASSVNRQAA